MSADWIRSYLTFHVMVGLFVGVPVAFFIGYRFVAPLRRDLAAARRRVTEARQASLAGNPSAAIKASK